jgi:hypothetical protein
MKYLLDFTYTLSIVLALILLFTSYNVFPQSNIIAKPGQVVKLTWNPSIESDVWQYAIFYCQGSDTTLFPISTGVDPDSLWKSEPISNWQYATIYDLKFSLEPKYISGITYLRLGVSAINQAGKFGLIQCINKVIRVKKPASITGVKIE